MTNSLPLPPALLPMARIRCEVDAVVSLGTAPYGERRFVPLRGGSVEGPELNGVVIAGGVDWQIQRADGVLDICAHYVVRTSDDALVEITSTGMRHADADVMRRLANGEPVDRADYYFRTVMRFQTGAPRWAHLNRTIAIASGEREARRVLLDVYRLT